MKNLHVIMPMGGLGTRTADAYYSPKPFINIYGKYLMEYALEGFAGLSASMNTKLTVVCRKDMLNKKYIQKINQIGWKFANSGFNLIQIDKLTQGPLETVMKAEQYIEDDDIVIVLDCDLLFESVDLYDIIERIDEYEDIDGFLFSFNSTDPKYSFAEIDENNIVKRTAEKQAISNHALAGIYGFANGGKFKKYARLILNKPVEEFNKNEYYVSYIYNMMIDDGARIILSYLDKYNSLGTSYEIEQFKNSDNIYKGLYMTDFDGTLVDTKEANCLAYQETFKKVYDYDMKPEEYYENFGLRINELLEKLGLDVEKLSEVKRTKAKVYKKYFDKIKINKNLVAELYYKKRAGHIIALATTASNKNVENLINYFELNGLFDYIITGENVKNGKPDPEVYNKIIEKFPYIPYWNRFIYEDSDVGILAAYHSQVNGNNIFNITKIENLHLCKFVTAEEFISKRQNNNITMG